MTLNWMRRHDDNFTFSALKNLFSVKKMIEGFKTDQSQVKASKLDKWLKV